MKWLAVTLIIVVLMDWTGGQYPECVSCTDGELLYTVFVLLL